MNRQLPFPVFDADNHLYETRDALTRYLPDRYRGAIDYVEVHGRTKIVVRGRITDYIPNPTFDRIGRPGAQADYFRHGNPEGKSQRELIGRGIDCPPAYRNAGDRLPHMDTQGLDYAMMIPTLASLVEERMTDDPDLAAAVVHGLNRWMLDEWPYVYGGRIFSTPVISPGEVGNAIAELEFVLAHGAKVVLMRPAPAWGWKGPRSFALPEFDPYWKLVEESGVLCLVHASDSGYTRYYNEWDGGGGENQAFAERSTFMHAMDKSFRDIQDAVISMICHGLCDRFPRLKIALVENGAGWVPGMLKVLDKTYHDQPHRFVEHPLETFKRCFWQHPFHEEDPTTLVDLIGADNVIFGSDYPHVEGLADPISYHHELARLPEADQAKIMGGNMIRVLGLAA